MRKRHIVNDLHLGFVKKSEINVRLPFLRV